jgi:hypothetical protein
VYICVVYKVARHPYMLKKLRHIFFLLALVLFSASCSKDQDFCGFGEETKGEKMTTSDGGDDNMGGGDDDADDGDGDGGNGQGEINDDDDDEDDDESGDINDDDDEEDDDESSSLRRNK